MVDDAVRVRGFAVILALLLPLSLYPETLTQKIRFDGLEAGLYVPQALGENPTLVVALHGMKESWKDSCEAWVPTAIRMNLILLCPNGTDPLLGFLRGPEDDRIKINGMVKALQSRYEIHPNQVVLAGFSRGGTIAIEMGVLYPLLYRRVICMYGYLNRGIEGFLREQTPSHLYRSSQFYFLTGKGDYSQLSMQKASDLFSKIQIPHSLRVFPTLRHQYPSDLDRLVVHVINQAKIETLSE